MRMLFAFFVCVSDVYVIYLCFFCVCIWVRGLCRMCLSCLCCIHVCLCADKRDIRVKIEREKLVASREEQKLKKKRNQPLQRFPLS